MEVDVNQRITPENFRELLPSQIDDLLDRRDGPAKLVMELPIHYSPEQVSPIAGKPKTEEQRIWELVGLHYLHNENFPRPHEALPIFHRLYNQMLEGQDVIGNRVHKGMPLVWISDCYRALGYRVMAKRYLMLTLCEDSMIYKGDVDTDQSGTYFRLVWVFGLPDPELRESAQRVFELHQQNAEESYFPEWVLQKLDQDWKTEIPLLQESAVYVANTRYLSHLISKLGDGTGKAMEMIAEYALSCIPGCRTTLRKRSATTEYDVVCSMDGLDVDFLSEIGRYFVCECKDRGKPASFSDIAKFCRVLDSTKSKFGILFSKKGISGQGRTLYADREKLKIYQDRGIAIVIIDLDDLMFLAEGGNFVSRIRSKYESLRLDLLETQKKVKKSG